MATVYIDNRAVPDEPGAEPAARAVCRWAAICRISAGIRRWARWAPAGNARSSSSRMSSDTHGKIVMACMTPASEGTRISIEDPEAAAFRRASLKA